MKVSWFPLVLSQRSVTYILLGQVLIHELKELLHQYEKATAYYGMELTELYLPAHYNELKQRWRYVVASLNEITIYLSMSDYGKALDVLDQALVNLRQLLLIPQNLEAIVSIRSFPEVSISNVFYCLVATESNGIHFDSFMYYCGDSYYYFVMEMRRTKW